MLDSKPKRKYKAAPMVRTVTVVFDVVGGCSDIIIAGTNAESAEVLVTDPNSLIWGDDTEWGTGGLGVSVEDWDAIAGQDWDDIGGDDWGGGANDDVCCEWANTEIAISASVIQRSKSEALFITLDQSVTVPCRVSMEFTGQGTIEIGAASANLSESYGNRDPNYGMKIGRIDYSIKDVNSNGSSYYFKKDIVRTFDINALFTNENAFLLLDNFDAIGEEPTGWKLTKTEGNEYVVFGKFDGPPVISNDHISHSNVSFRIVEVL
jgi:hypothetical protein